MATQQATQQATASASEDGVENKIALLQAEFQASMAGKAGADHKQASELKPSIRRSLDTLSHGSVVDLVETLMQSPEVKVCVLSWLTEKRRGALEDGTRAAVLRQSLEAQIAQAKAVAAAAVRQERYDDATAITDTVAALYETVVESVSGTIDALEELDMLNDLARCLHECTPSSKATGETVVKGTDLLARLDDAAKASIGRITARAEVDRVTERADAVSGRVRASLELASVVFANDYWVELRCHGLFKDLSLAAGITAAPLLADAPEAKPPPPMTTAEVYLAAMARLRSQDVHEKGPE